MKQGQTEQLVTETSGVETEVENKEKEKESEKMDSIEEMRSKLNELPDKEFLEYLDTGLYHNPTRHQLTQQDIDRMMERSMSLLERNLDEIELDDLHIDMIINNAVQLYGDFKREDPQQESITDKAFKACIKLYEKYPNAGHEMQNLFGQDHTVRRDITIDALVDAHSNPRLFEDLFQSLLYLFAFGGDSYEKRIAERLDFDNPENFRATGIFLECIGRLYAISSDTSFAEENASRLLDLIKRAIANNKGSYYLNLRARDIVKKLETGRNHPGTGLKFRPSGEFSGLSPEEIQDISYLESPNIKGLIEADLGTPVADLDDLERRFFLSFSKNKSAEGMAPIKDFIGRYGRSGLRTFLSMQYDRSLGDKVVAFGNHSAGDFAENIFVKYCSIIDAAQNVDKYVREAYGLEATLDVIGDIHDRLTKKAAEILSSFIDEADKGSDDSSRSALVDRLDTIQSDILVLANSFKGMRRQKDLRIDDIKEASLETYAPGEKIPDKTKEQMMDIFTENRSHGVYPERLAEASKKEFTDALESQTGEFHVLSFHEKVLAFVRFEPRGEGRLYVGSLNVRPEIKGTDLGTEFISQLINVKSSGYSLEAAVWEHNKNLPFFIKTLGFKRAGEMLDHLGSGERFIRLERVQGK